MTAARSGDAGGTIPAGPRRIVIASPMKCASTYVAAAVADYVGADVPQVEYDWLAEQNLTYELRTQLKGRAFVLSLHMRPHHGNLVAARDDDVRTVLLWRNLADTIVSFDEHVPRYGGHNPLFFLEDEPFLAMPQQERYRFLIDMMVPWSTGFFLHWSRVLGVAPFNPYELLVTDPRAYFSQLLVHAGAALDEARLRGTLAFEPAFSRYNVGIAGRSAQRFSDETKRHLERHILGNPARDQLEVLLWELPWEPLELARVSSHDGTTVRIAGDERTWFVSRGLRRAVTPRWVASRATRALREPVEIGADAARELPEAPALT